MKTTKEQEVGKKYVYVANFQDGYVKIGRSVDPKKRLRNIEICNKIKVKDYFLIEGYADLEKMLHEKYREFRRYSEFFKLDIQEIFCFIESIEFKESYKEFKKTTKKIDENYQDEINEMFGLNKLKEQNKYEFMIRKYIDKLLKMINHEETIYKKAPDSLINELKKTLELFEKTINLHDMGESDKQIYEEIKNHIK